MGTISTSRKGVLKKAEVKLLALAFPGVWKSIPLSQQLIGSTKRVLNCLWTRSARTRSHTHTHIYWGLTKDVTANDLCCQGMCLKFESGKLLQSPNKSFPFAGILRSANLYNSINTRVLNCCYSHLY